MCSAVKKRRRERQAAMTKSPIPPVTTAPPNPGPSISMFVFERQRNARAKGEHFAVFDFHVHLHDFSDAQITQRGRSRFDGVAACIFPGILTDADHVDNAINALRRLLLGHGVVLSRLYPNPHPCECDLKGRRMPRYLFLDVWPARQAMNAAAVC